MGSAVATVKPGTVEPSESGRGPDAVRDSQPTAPANVATGPWEKASSIRVARIGHTAAADASTVTACSSTYGNSSVSTRTSVEGSGPKSGFPATGPARCSVGNGLVHPRRGHPGGMDPRPTEDSDTDAAADEAQREAVDRASADSVYQPPEDPLAEG